MRERSASRCAEIFLHFAKPQKNFKHMKTRLLKIFVFLIILTISNTSEAQGWISEFGTYGNEESDNLSVTALENGNNVLLINSPANSILYYLNAKGVELWHVDYDEFLGYKIIESQNGGFWVLGTKSTPHPAYPEILEFSASLTKLDETGALLFQKRYDYHLPGSPNEIWEYDTAVDLVELADGTVIILADGPEQTIHIYKVDQNGEEIWAKSLDPELSSTVTFRISSDLIATTDGNFLIAGCHQLLPQIGYTRSFLLKFNAEGEILWHNHYIDIVEDEYSNATIGVGEATDGGYFIGVQKHSSSVPINQGFLTKTNSEGNIEWTINFNPALTQEPWAIDDMVQAPNGDLVFIGHKIPDPNTNYLLRINQQGELIFQRSFDVLKGDQIFHIENAANGGFLILGKIEEALPSVQTNILLVKTDGLGTIYSNAIQGSVINDENENCLEDQGEPGYKNWLIRADGPRTFYGITDSLGNYFIDVDTGVYEVQVLTPIPYWEACNPISYVNLSNFQDTSSIDFILQDTVNCPLLEVDISTPFLRRCFENTYNVYYGNIGTATSENTMVVIEFDDFLDINSSTIPWLSIEGNTYTFEVDDLAPGEVGSFKVNATVNCDNAVLGQTHCVTAHIYPDSLCVDPDPNWDGASLIVTGTCEEDSVRFIVRNIGLGDMDEPVPYLVVEDNVMLNNDFIQLNSQEEIEFTFPANGATYYFGALQTPGHPGQDFPNAVVEGCGGPLMSLGYVSQFPENDGDPFISMDCQENIGSYDPNDKIGYPIGWTEDHFIEKNTDIEYRIRFQNTGTDTAFNIYILDTLSEHLDISKLRPGVSSHPYELDIIDGSILRFTFNNIMLPDSNVNEAASNGFVKFKIAQQQDLPLGTVLYNDAAIYFDFNPPIITNETFHTIGERLLTSTEPVSNQSLQASNIQIYPNPFREQTTIEVSQNIKLPIQFALYDLRGQLIREEVQHSHQFAFERKDLPKGLYFYVLKYQNQIVQTAKLIIQ